MVNGQGQVWWEDLGPGERALQRVTAASLSRRALLALLASAGGTAVLAACGRGDGRRRLVQEDRTGRRGERRGEPLPDEHQVLHLTLWADPVSHDWNKTPHAGGIPELFAPLLILDQDYQLQPWAAERMVVSADGTKYTFHLRKDATWTNGQPVTADDWVYSFTRILLPSTKAPHAPLYYNIVGAEDLHTGRNDDVRRLGLKALDRFTFEITLNQPAGYFPMILALWGSCPAYAPAVEKFGDRWTEPEAIVSNGPFKLTKWEHHEELVAERRSDWWSALAKPKLREIRYRIIPPEMGILPYEQGEVDVTPVPAQDFQLVMNNPQLKQEALFVPLFTTWYLIGEINQKPFDDIRVRRALQKVIDRDLIATKVLHGQGRAAYSLVYPGFFGSAANDRELVEAQRFDPKAALELLRGTPYEGGKNWPKVKLTIDAGRDGSRARLAAEAIQQMLGRYLNMPVELQTLDKQALLNRLQTSPEARDIQLALLSWTPEYPHPHSYMTAVLYGGRPSRRHAWRDAWVDAQIVSASRTGDLKEAAALYEQIDKKVVVEHAVLTYVMYTYSAFLYKPYVHGLALNKQGEFVPPNNFYRAALSRDLYISRS